MGTKRLKDFIYKQIMLNTPGTKKRWERSFLRLLTDNAATNSLKNKRLNISVGFKPPQFMAFGHRSFETLPGRFSTLRKFLLFEWSLHPWSDWSGGQDGCAFQSPLEVCTTSTWPSIFLWESPEASVVLDWTERKEHEEGLRDLHIRLHHWPPGHSHWPPPKT